VAAVLGDDRTDGRYVPDLMMQRLRVVAMQRLLAISAGCGFALVDGAGVIDEGALDLGVSGLTARFVVGRQLGWRALEGRRVGRGRLGGIGGVLLEALLEFIDLLLRSAASGDLKPGNVVVGSFGEVQVMDWGLAKVLTRIAVPVPG
jgi:hypothetical protein